MKDPLISAHILYFWENFYQLAAMHARPAPAPGKMAAPAPKIFKTATPHPIFFSRLPRSPPKQKRLLPPSLIKILLKHAKA